jgi:hypothetical protein
MYPLGLLMAVLMVVAGAVGLAAKPTAIALGWTLVSAGVLVVMASGAIGFWAAERDRRQPGAGR